MDVLHILHGEVGSSAGRHAVLRSQETRLRQRRQHRGQKGEHLFVHVQQDAQSFSDHVTAGCRSTENAVNKVNIRLVFGFR